MSAKSISLSVRLSPEDAATLASLDFPDATTPSEKIRALIKQASTTETSGDGYADQLAHQHGKLSNTTNSVVAGEAKFGKHSELLAYFARWAPEVLAFYIFHAPRKDEKQPAGMLKVLEHGVADRIFLLFDHVLRLAVTGESPCYDRKLIVSRARTVTQLAGLISQHLTEEEVHNG